MRPPVDHEVFGFDLKAGQKVIGTECHVDEDKNLLFRKHFVKPGENGKAEVRLYDHPDGNGGWKAGRGPQVYRSHEPALAGSTHQRAGSLNEDQASFQLIHVGDLEYRPPEYLIEGLLETDTLGVTFGAPASAKSFIAVDIALCVATGTPFHGRSVKRGPVIYIAGEGRSGLARRFGAWSAYHEVPLQSAACYMSTCAASFLDSKSAETVTAAVHKIAEKKGAPALIVIDTLARNFGPGDENSTAEMSRFVAALDRLRGEFPGSTILVIHHSGHSDHQRARGAMALKGALDSEYRVEKAENLVTLVNTKMKDAPQPSPIALKLEDVAIGNGASSAVLVETEAPRRTEKVSSAHKLARDTYISAAIASSNWRDDTGGGLHINEWRIRFYAEHTGHNNDTKRQAFNRVRKELQREGLISVDDNFCLWDDAAIIKAIYSGREGSCA